MAEAVQSVSPLSLSISQVANSDFDGCVVLQVQPKVVLPEEVYATMADVVVTQVGILPPFAEQILEQKETIGSWTVGYSGTAELAPVAYTACANSDLPVRLEFELFTVDALSGARVSASSSSAVIAMRDQRTVVLSGQELVVAERTWADSLGLELGEQFSYVDSEGLSSDSLWMAMAADLGESMTIMSDRTSSASPKALLLSGTTILFGGNWKYLESRTNCEPEVSAGGSTDAFFRCSTQDTSKGLRGLRVELWRLRSSTWTKLATTYTTTSSSSGQYILQFTSSWLDTDQYKVKVFLERGVEGDTTGAWRWRCLNDGNLTWAQTSTISGTVYGDNMIIGFGSYTILGEESRICASLQDAWLVHGSNDDLQDDLLNLEVDHWVVTAPETCPDQAVGCLGRYYIRICRESGDDVPWHNGYIAAHEFGHVLHRHSWAGSFGANYDYGGESDDWHSWTSAEWQETTLIEGFAEFVSASAYYGPSASAPKYEGYSMSDPPNGGADPVCVSTTLPEGTGPERNEGNVARYFWDIFDSVYDDAYVDTLELSSSMIFEKLYSFPSGTANRQRSESDTDGPNIYDYYYHVLYSGSPVYGSIDQMYSNCLENSDWN